MSLALFLFQPPFWRNSAVQSLFARRCFSVNYRVLAVPRSDHFSCTTPILHRRLNVNPQKSKTFILLSFSLVIFAELKSMRASRFSFKNQPDCQVFQSCSITKSFIAFQLSSVNYWLQNSRHFFSEQKPVFALLCSLVCHLVNQAGAKGTLL